jgi:hypothetical protein
MNARARTGIAIAIVGLTGCISGYAAPPGTGAFADMTFEKGYGQAKMLGGSSQTYFAHEGHSCDGIRRLASFNWSAGATKTRRVAAGIPINLSATLVENSDAGYNSVWVDECRALVSFTPRAGVHYRVVQTRSCQIEITDIASGATPEDVVRSRAPDCGF